MTVAAFLKKDSRAAAVLLNIAGLAAVLFMILKAPYGFGTADECYYLITPMRLVQGDALLVDEWFIAQLFGAVSFPVLKLYMLIAKSSAGIILAFRYIYIAIKSLSAIYVYRRLRKISDMIPSFMAALLFLVYTPFDIMGLSYNTIGIISITMACAAFSSLKEKERITPAAAGFLYALSVICCPYLAVLYVLYLIAVFTAGRARALRGLVQLRISTWVKVSAGIALAAALFAVLVLTRGSVSQIRQTLPFILDNPTHQSLSLTGSLRLYADTVIIWDKKRLLIIALTAVIFLLSLIIKKMQKLKALLFFFTAILTLLYVFLPGYPHDMANHFILPVNLTGLVCFALCEKKKTSLFIWMWIPGIIYSFALFLSSNQGFYAVSSATMASALCSVIFILDFARELTEESRSGALRCAVLVLSSAIILLQLAAVCVSVYEHCFWDGNRSTLSVKIDRGCEKGLITSPSFADSYYSLWDETEELREAEDGRSLYVVTEKLWLLLDDEKPEGSCFSYIEGDDAYRADNLKAYFEMKPENRPSYIFIDSGCDRSIYAGRLGFDESLFITGALGDHMAFGVKYR